MSLFNARAGALPMLAFGALLAVATIQGPVQAQMFSDGYEFLKSVKERDGDAVMQVLNEPGSGAVIVNARDRASGETALHIVTRRRDTVWIRFLTQRGANPNIADKNGETPLVVASNLGFVDGVEALIKAGAQVDISSDTGETPLINAVHRRDTAMVRVLLENGANPDLADNSGRTARDYVELLSGNTAIKAEFAAADEKRESDNTPRTYGPSL